jgi:hypothetical protein
MLPKNNTNDNNNKKAHRVLALTIFSLSIVSLIITISAPNYSSAQISDTQNATTVGGIPSAISTGMNITTIAASPTTTVNVRTFIEQAHMALQNNDIQGALMNVDSAIAALEDIGGNGEQNSNMTATNPQNEVTADQTTTTEAGTIGSGGAGGAGTAGGIMTGNQTTTDAGTIGSGGAGGAGTAGGIITGNQTIEDAGTIGSGGAGGAGTAGGIITDGGT